jgi:uncharacterized protein GlcG (DUF336 family)
MRTPLILALTLFAAPALAQEAAPASGPPAPKVAAPSDALAREAAQAAVSTCERMGYKTMATVVDTTGRPVAAVTSAPDQAGELAPVSVKSAAAAAEFNSASSDVAARAKGDAGVFYTVHNDPRLNGVTAGGVPLAGADNPKGAIGVAGAQVPEKNEACAQAGAQRIASRLK